MSSSATTTVHPDSLPLALSDAAAPLASRRTALIVLSLSVGLFLALLPFAQQFVAAYPLFIPVNQTVLVVNDVITATMLLAQLRLSRSLGVLVLACAYAFSALVAVAHMLSFPGVFAAQGLLGGGAQTTAYLYISWHTGFALIVGGYVLMARRKLPDWISLRKTIPFALGVTALVAALVAITCTAGHELLPAILAGTQYSPGFHFFQYGQWVATAAVLVLLWRRKPHSLLDLWMLVVLSAWFFEIGLTAIFNAGRYDVGFYAGRVYALFASAFVLGMLLVEQYRLYGDLVNARRQAASAEELRNNREVVSMAMRSGRMGAWSYNIAKTSFTASPEMESIFGIAPRGGSATRDELQRVVHRDDFQNLRDSVRAAVRDHQEFTATFRFRHADGQWRWMEARGRPAIDVGGPEGLLFGVAADVTERKAAQEAQARFELRFRTMVDAIPQLAFMARPDGWMYWYNRRWYEYTGTSPSEMEGWGWQRVHDPAVLPAVNDRWQQSLRSGEPFEMVFPLRGADGQFRSFLTRISPLKDEGGNVTHWFGTNTDITAQLRAEEELRSADRRKDEFLATLAHELRNPLAPIRSAVDIMHRSASLPRDLHPLRAMLDRQSRHLARLVDDLLELARITQGKVELRRQPASVVQCLHEAIEAVRPSLDGARHDLRVVVCADPLVADIDPTRIVQTFVNLLVNAVKFTPAGGRIEVAARREGAQALVRVRDTGIGIAATHIDHLFEMFSQPQPAIDRTVGGLGIGLALVRGLVQLHGGTVQAHSDGQGQGSEFTVRLPLAPAESFRPHQGDEDDTASGTPAQSRRVLVIDDNHDACATLAALLRMEGHEVREAHDGPEGIDAAKAFAPDLVLLDIGMPGMSGYEVAQALRKLPGGGALRIVAVTGWSQDHDRQRSREAGFDHHLAKPVGVDELLKLLA
jgi:PAS domain S-box-containing protein